MSEQQSPPQVDRILLVDDEEGIRTVLGITLEDKGYAVTKAASGQEALAQFDLGMHPIVLTDIKMPGMDGISLLKEIKDRRPETEVIMITGHGDMDLAVTSMQYGSADFISKPVGTDALEVALHRAEERIHMRRQIKEYTEDLERLVEERTSELLDAERMAAVGHTVTDLSHTIKNIASGLEGGIYVLGKGIELDEKKYLHQGWELVEGNVAKVKKLSLALLNFAKFGRIDPSPCDPVAPAIEAVQVMQSRAENEAITLIISSDNAPETANIDHDAMVRLLLNLLENGMDAYIPSQEDAPEPSGEPESKPLKLTISKEDGQLVYQVEDKGAGLPPNAEGQLLTAFFTTKGSAGTGIGLMTCRKIAEQHGGTIHLAPANGCGTVVTVRIPL